MRKILLLIATLSLCAFAWAQTADDMQSAGQDFYNQHVTTQAQQNSLTEAAIAQSAAVEAQSESWSSEQPGSIASNSGEDFYDSTVESQAKLNSLIEATINPSAAQDQEAMPADQETSSVAEPGSMASDEGAQSTDEDFYNQKVDAQADLNGSFLDANRLQASAQPEGSSGSEQPGSMAADEGGQSTSSYDETVAIQANANRMIQQSNQSGQPESSELESSQMESSQMESSQQQ